MTHGDDKSNHERRLIAQAAAGDSHAITELFARVRPRLRRMIEMRLDPRMAQRVDPSDLVQETLTAAHLRLEAYANDLSLAFYPWVCQIARNILIDTFRRHVGADRRSVNREVVTLADQSMNSLVNSIASGVLDPLNQLMQSEAEQRVRDALSELKDADRDVLVLRHVDQMSVSEAADALGVAEGTVKSRHFRALQRLKSRLADSSES